MFKIQKLKKIWNLKFEIFNLPSILNLGFRILNQPLIFEVMIYGKETSKKYQKVYQKRKGSDSSRSFRFEGSGETNSRALQKIF